MPDFDRDQAEHLLNQWLNASNGKPDLALGAVAHALLSVDAHLCHIAGLLAEHKGRELLTALPITTGAVPGGVSVLLPERVLTAAEARTLAAGLLNAADRADDDEP